MKQRKNAVKKLVYHQCKKQRKKNTKQKQKLQITHKITFNAKVQKYIHTTSSALHKSTNAHYITVVNSIRVPPNRLCVTNHIRIQITKRSL